MSKSSPLALVKEKFGDKKKLVEAVEKFTNDDLWVARTNKAKGLAHVSNAKLLRLQATFAAVKEKFGTREKLVEAILDLQKRSQDAGFRQRLLSWPVPRLYDAYQSTAKRMKRAETGTTDSKVPAKPAAAAAVRKVSAPKAASAESSKKPPVKKKSTGSAKGK
ncbi:MAG: hypothetical protein M3O50_13400 [Myxococcota bacterium]|nr:hypothetical protein [Myxococcota bacterium]